MAEYIIAKKKYSKKSGKEFFDPFTSFLTADYALLILKHW